MELAVSPSQLRVDLRGEFRGRIADDPVTRALYETDASPFQITPAAVAFPNDEADVAALIRYCQANGLPIVARGAGTGLAGESLGAGIVIDLAERFRSIVRIDADTVTVEPGVALAELNGELARHGRRFAPDPASAATCTIGGMIATNASGGNAYRFGYTRDHVHSLRVVWDTGNLSHITSPTSGGIGTKVSTSVEPWNAEDGLRITEIRSQTAALLTRHREEIAACRPTTRFNRCGYVLHDVLTSAGLDLAKLLVGSEGTLGIITQATLRTIPLPGAVGMTVLGFPSLDAAMRAGLALRTAAGVVACDLLDPRQLAFSRTVRPSDGIGPIPPTIGAALVITVEADSQREATTFGRAAVDRLQDVHRFVLLAGPSCDPVKLERIRKFRQAAVSGLYALGPGPRPVAAIEDVGVPAEELPRFVAETQQALRRYDLAGSFLIHVLTGQVHTRPFVDIASPSDREKLWAVAEEVHGLALKLGGTVSTQHGTGLARTPWVAKQYGPLLPVFRELKRIFDPKEILNPGKILGPDPSRPAWPFRGSIRPGQSHDVGELRTMESKPARVPLLGTSDWITPTLAACNGCGDCRTRTPPTRMCPIFHATGAESATPRGKVNVFRQLLGIMEAGERVPFEDVREVADLCINCKMCRQECRAGVDVPKLMLEAKAADHAERGFERTDWMLARVEMLMGIAGNFAFTTNALLASRPTRWIMEKLFGLSRHRTLPKFTHRTFLRRAKRAGLTKKFGTRNSELGIPEPELFAALRNPNSAFRTRRLAYFVDVYANYNDPLVAEAAVAVLRFHGFEVYVPPRQKGSGMPALAAGDLDTAREIAAHNVRILADLVRDGYTIVCSEPTAALALTQDYLDLSDDPDTQLVAGHTVELMSLLWQVHSAGRLHRGFRPLDLDLGHHVPCHLKALRGSSPAGARLLELIPGVRVHTIDRSCSGMAGVWGLKSENYETSLAAGRPMIEELNRPRVMFGSTECGPCRMQMQQGSGKRALHPVQYLALAYGLLPELDAKLRRPLGSLVTD